MPNPNHVILEEHKIAFMLPAKVANTSIKAAILKARGIVFEDFYKYHHTNEFVYASKEEIAALGPDWLKIGFVRNPWDRLMACYADKYHPSWDFDGFINLVMSTKDYGADIHFRSQSYDLCIDGVPVPWMVVKIEEIESDQVGWGDVQLMAGHRGLRLGPLPKLNPDNGQDFNGFYSDPVLVQKVGERYAEDIKIFKYSFKGVEPVISAPEAPAQKAKKPKKADKTTNLTPHQAETVVQITAKLAKQDGGQKPGPIAVRYACGRHAVPELSDGEITNAFAEAKRRSPSLDLREVIGKRTFRPEPPAA